MTQPDELSSMNLVTDVTTTGVAPELDRAVQAADGAAQSAGVSVRELVNFIDRTPSRRQETGSQRP